MEPPGRQKHARKFYLWGVCGSGKLTGVSLSAPNSPARLYKIHRKRYREIPGWELTFPQWWSLWRLRWHSRDTKHLVIVPENSRPRGGFFVSVRYI